MTDEELAAAEEAGGSRVLHIPTVFGAVALAYNVEGVANLRLDAQTLAAIFLGEITMWDDPALVTLNPEASLPEEDIRVVHRSDASGTTSIFTDYLSAISPAWDGAVGTGKYVEWPVGVGGQGNDGVAAVIQQQSGSIGYVELSYALESGLAMVTLQNRAGNYITPSLETTSAAAEGVEFPEDLRFSVTDSEGTQAYPIMGATWILAYEQMPSAAKVGALRDWLAYALNAGAVIARELGYAPLPDSLKALALAKVEMIRVF